MENDQSSENNTGQLTDDLREYVKLQVSFFKLTLVEKLSRIMALLLLILLAVVLLSLAFFYFSFAALGWVSVWLGSRETALLLFGAFFLILAGILFLYREKWLVNGFIKLLSRIIFEEGKDGQ